MKGRFAIAPDCDGGVNITFRAAESIGNRYASICFDDTGEVFLILEPGVGSPRVRKLDTIDRGVLAEIESFLCSEKR